MAIQWNTPTTTKSGIKWSSPAAPTPSEQPKKDGFIKSVAKDALGTLLVKPAARTTEALGRLGVFGENIKRGYEEMTDEKQTYLGVDVDAQKAFGKGGGKQILGDAAKSASYLYTGGNAPAIAATTKLGRIGQGIVQGAKIGAVSGGLYGAGEEIQKEDSTIGSVAASAGLSALAGGVGGAVLGGLLPAPVAAKNAPKAARALAPGIMQRVARISPSAQQKFRQTTGKSVGDYLVERGIYGNENDIMQQLAVRMSKSKAEVDNGLAKLAGEFKNGPVDDMLKELADREVRVSSPNVPSKDLARVQELAAKNDATGLTMAEVNEIKRLYERNVRLGYLKSNNAEAVVKATNIDDAVREWQIAQAKDLGFTNLRELNKETQAAKLLGDELWKTTTRKGANNALGLYDVVLLAGGDPSSLSMFLARRAFSSKDIQSALAKRVATKPTVGEPKAVFKTSTQATPPQPRTELPKSSPSTVLPQGPQSSNASGQLLAEASAKLPDGTPKYKTAEEFVKAQGTPRDTLKYTLDDDGFFSLESLTDTKTLNDSGRRVPRDTASGWIDEEGFAHISRIDAGTQGTRLYERVITELKEQGHNMLAVTLQSTPSKGALNRLVDEGKLKPLQFNEYGVPTHFEITDVIKTKSQLTDIWKKANEQSALPKADMFAAGMAVNPNEEGDPDVKNILAAIAVGAISRKTPKAELLAMLKKLEKERVRLINSPAKNPKVVAQVEHGLARLNDTVKRLLAQL